MSSSVSPPFPALHSILCTHSLRSFISEVYELAPIVEIRLLKCNLNDTYLVCTAQHRYILRIYRHGWRTHPDILYEMDALGFLAKNGINIGAPVLRKDYQVSGLIEAVEGSRYAVLLDAVPGDPIFVDRNNSYRMGRLAALLHNVSDGFSSPHARFSLDIDHIFLTPLQTIGDSSHGPGPLFANISALVEEITPVMKDLEYSQLDFGFCHGDFHSANILDFNGDLHLIDIDCGGSGWRMYDIACFWWFTRNVNRERIFFDPFLDGYKSLRTISEDDISALPFFLLSRHLWLLALNLSNRHHTGNWFIDTRYINDWLKFVDDWSKTWFALKDSNLGEGGLTPWFLEKSSANVTMRHSPFRTALRRIYHLISS